MNDFEEALFSCNKTPGLFCALVLFSCVGSPCCVQGRLVSRVCKSNFALHCFLPCGLGCIGAAYNRGRLREKYSMRTAYLSDCFVHLCCTICAVNQEFLEVHRRQGSSILDGRPSFRPKKYSFTPEAPIFQGVY
ncbi:unnamed protein product [Blepharisma stoltei]|uniref:PLAC8 family protein n=1 Tax=Blepharisma stoltei TaxID=1481888 RepID=A0AAU9JJ32_9CILI|nr:unnamed protein product [Blepharisma stoltei]